jgi:hypothetical protein
MNADQRRHKEPRAQPTVALAWPVHARRGTYHEYKPPVFTLADPGNGETYVHPAKAADEAPI